MTNDGEWPMALAGVVESVTTTLGPNGRWNAAPLGLHAGTQHALDRSVRARTWGRTRTRRNLDRAGRAHVHFITDPVVFVEAALGIYETDEPVLDAAAAWTRVDAHAVAEGETDGTTWVDWELRPVESEVRRRVVPQWNRATGAVVELTVAASRVDVPAFDDEPLADRLEHFAAVIERCGGPRERAALARAVELTGWQPSDHDIPAEPGR